MTLKRRDIANSSRDEFDTDLNIVPPMLPSQVPFGITSRQSSLVPDDIPTLSDLKLPNNDPYAPKDKFNFVLITFTFIGVVQLMPMIFLITANEYWMYKFRTVDPNNTDDYYTNATNRNYLQATYGSYDLIVITVTGIICSFFTTFFVHKISLITRAYMTLTCFPLIFVFEVVMVHVNTDSWQNVFFGLTLLIQVIFSLLLSVAGAGVMTIVSKFPGHYMKLYLMGQGIGDLISSVLRLISITIVDDILGEAFLYFATGLVLLLMGLFLFIIATRTEFFKYHMRSVKNDTKRKIYSIKEILLQAKSIWQIILLNFLSTFVPVLSITNLVVSEYKGTGSTWGDKYFITVMTYFLAAFGDLVGRGLSVKFDTIFSLLWLFSIVTVRCFAFGIVIMFTRAYPRSHLPIVFGHDWQYGIIISTFTLTRGFFSNVVTLQMFKMVPQEKYELSVLINMFFMGATMAVSSLFSLLMVSWL